MIQRVGEEAFERVREVRLRALRDAPDAFASTYEREIAMAPDEWRGRLTRPNSATFVASLDGADVGLVTGLGLPELPGEAVLVGMWVAPEARGRGVSDALVGAVVEWARAGGHRVLRLDVADGNEHAIRLYARMGFEPTGTTSTLPPPREHVTEHERARDLTP
jgi:GNAT superfamily N-acetyltransferase